MSLRFRIDLVPACLTPGRSRPPTLAASRLDTAFPRTAERAERVAGRPVGVMRNNLS